MICTDERIVNICTELFAFLKSDKTDEIIHNKTLTKAARGGTVQTEITVGFLTVRMVWQPFVKDGDIARGSDEGASVFVYMPFAESAQRTAQKFELKGYYSERGSEKRLTVIVHDIYKTNPIGPKRVASVLKVTTTNPFAAQ